MSDKIFNRCIIALCIIAAVLIWTDDRGQCATDTECAQLYGED